METVAVISVECLRFSAETQMLYPMDLPDVCRIKAAREQILQNFRSWRSNRPEYFTFEEWETQVLEMTGDSLGKFETRTTGKAVSDARLDSYIDLAILT